MSALSIAQNPQIMTVAHVGIWNFGKGSLPSLIGTTGTIGTIRGRKGPTP